ncbi:MAG TPA: hypothetical protein VGT04_15555 [Acidobacteriaceae bacterium]|nr:hypothetical protein [Acidobacteriaceae bacterium]
MDEKTLPPEMDPYEFILENIDSVPHLEALVLLWNSRPAGWTQDELASRLYVPQQKVADILYDLLRVGLIVKSDETTVRYRYLAASEGQDRLMTQVDAVYRRDLVRISTMIHSKASPAIRDFARAFRFTKERE